MSTDIFRDKVAWITGASSGIGAALAKNLSKAGCKVILSARRADKLKEVAGNLEDSYVLPLDLSDNHSLPDMARTAYDKWGRIDFMVHNGGLSQRAKACELDLENTRLIMETNFFSAVTLTKEIMPRMIRDGGGHFIVISSLMGKFGAPGRSTYAASKHALHGYFDALRAEEWENGIRVTMVTPGYIKTEFSINALNADGNPHGKVDPGQEGGMDVDKCAELILAGVAKGKEELLVGGLEKYGVLLKRFAPGILSRILRGKNID